METYFGANTPKPGFVLMRLPQKGGKSIIVMEPVKKASNCIQGGQCETACPQQVNVITRLQERAANFGV